MIESTFTSVVDRRLERMKNPQTKKMAFARLAIIVQGRVRLTPDENIPTEVIKPGVVIVRKVPCKDTLSVKKTVTVSQTTTTTQELTEEISNKLEKQVADDLRLSIGAAFARKLTAALDVGPGSIGGESSSGLTADLESRLRKTVSTTIAGRINSVQREVRTESKSVKEEIARELTSKSDCGTTIYRWYEEGERINVQIYLDAIKVRVRFETKVNIQGGGTGVKVGPPTEYTVKSGLNKLIAQTKEPLIRRTGSVTLDNKPQIVDTSDICCKDKPVQDVVPEGGGTVPREKRPCKKLYFAVDNDPFIYEAIEFDPAVDPVFATATWDIPDFLLSLEEEAFISEYLEPARVDDPTEEALYNFLTHYLDPNDPINRTLFVSGDVLDSYLADTLGGDPDCFQEFDGRFNPSLHLARLNLSFDEFVTFRDAGFRDMRQVVNATTISDIENFEQVQQMAQLFIENRDIQSLSGDDIRRLVVDWGIVDSKMLDDLRRNFITIVKDRELPDDQVKRIQRVLRIAPLMVDSGS